MTTNSDGPLNKSSRGRIPPHTGRVFDLTDAYAEPAQDKQPFWPHGKILSLFMRCGAFLPRLTIPGFLCTAHQFRLLRGLESTLCAVPLPLVATLGIALAAALTLKGQQLLLEPHLSIPACGMYAAGVLVAMLLARYTNQSAPPISRPGRPDASTSTAPPTQKEQFSKLQQYLLAAALIGGAVIWLQVRGRGPTAHYADVVIVWLLTLCAVLLSSSSISYVNPQRSFAILCAVLSRSRGDAILVSGILALALVPRLISLDQFPYIFGGDEGSQAMSGVAVLQGQITNPFGTGWYSLPNLFFYLQAASISLFGDSVAGVRVVTALIGGLAVLFTYFLAFRLFGRGVAISASIFLAVYHYHVFFSRLASVQAADTLFVVVALYFLDRGFVKRQRRDCVLAGIAIGLSQYFSFAGRLMLGVLVLYLLFVVVKSHGRQSAHERACGYDHPIRLAGWTLIGALLTVMPLLAYYVDHPIEFTSRLNQVSMFATGWLATAQQTTGEGPLGIILQQMSHAALLPFHTPPSGWYRGGPPLAGAPMAPFVALGLAVTSFGALRRQYFGLAVAYWGAVLGLGLTDNPAETQRFVIVSPLLAIFAGIGLCTIMHIATDLIRVRPADAAAIAAMILVGVGAWNLDYYFLTPGETRLYGNANSLVATELGYYLRYTVPDHIVYFAGTPRMVYHGFQTLPFIARDTVATDVEQPWESAASIPPIEGPTVFVFIPERALELELVRTRFPGGWVRSFYVGQARLLFLAYEVELSTDR